MKHVRRMDEELINSQYSWYDSKKIARGAEAKVGSRLEKIPSTIIKLYKKLVIKSLRIWSRT